MIGADNAAEVAKVAAERERDAVMAWLRGYAAFLDKHDDGWSGFDKMAQGAREAIEAIELGEHLAAQDAARD